MTSFNFDDVFKEAEAAGFGPTGDLGVGKYDATIVTANVGDSQAGDPKLGFMFKAAEGSVDAEDHGVSGATIWLNLTFSENGGVYAARDAMALGLTPAMLKSDTKAAVATTVGQVWRIDVVLSKDKEWMNVRLKKHLVEEEKADDKPKAKKAKPPAPKQTPASSEEAIEEALTEGDPVVPADDGNVWDI